MRKEIGVLDDKTAELYSCLLTQMRFNQQEYYALQHHKGNFWGILAKGYGLDIEKNRYEVEIAEDGKVKLYFMEQLDEAEVAPEK